MSGVMLRAQARVQPARSVPRTAAKPCKTANHERVAANCACGGGCPRCNTPVTDQTGPAISIAQDRIEHEAERFADSLTQTFSPTPPATGDDISRRPATLHSKISRDIHSLQGGGTPLSADTRGFFEPRLNMPLSDVRIHTDRRAAEAARALDTRAFTYGRDIAFAAQQYAPHTGVGQRLLGHELAHVAQQSPGRARVIARDPPTAELRSVSQVNIDCGANLITFITSNGTHSYTMSVCNVTPGEYDANVRAEPGNVFFDLGESVPKSVEFEFAYDIAPGQDNPSTFFGSQRQVHISAFSSLDFGSGIFEIPIEFIGAPLLLPESDIDIAAPGGPVTLTGETSGVPGYPLSVGGLSAHVLASGDLSWLSRSAGAGRLMSPEYWSPFVPGRGYTTIDRLTNTLPRNLAPRIEGELAAGRTLSWVVRRGFTEAELRSIPDLVARVNSSGVGSLSTAELSILRRAAALHIGGSTPGAPFASFTSPNFTPPFLDSATPPRFRVRMEVPSSSVLDVSGPNAFTMGREALTNLEEAEFLVVANHEGRIVSVERIGSSAEPGFLIRHSGKIRWGGRLLFVAGLGLSAYRISEAAPEERPVVAAEEAGGHLGGFAGTALAVSGCVFFGIATGGIGLFVCGLAGGIAGGVTGSALAGGMARSAMDAGDSTPCPSCHAMQREWERDRISADFSGLDFDTSLLPPDAVPLSPRLGEPGTAPLSSEELEMIRQWLDEAPGPAAE